MNEVNSPRPARFRSTRKKDAAPRGVFRHESGAWAIRFACGAGHIHEEKIGSIKGDAIRVHAARRQRVHDDANWCLKVEGRQARERAREEQERQRTRLTFGEFATDYLTWCQQTDSEGQIRKRSWRTIKAELTKLRATFGSKPLDEITTADVERFIDGLLASVCQATANRYRDRLSAMFKRAMRLQPPLVTVNPVTSIPKFRETGDRLVCLTERQETAIRDALPVEMRPHFDFALHTGLRWSKQMGLRWREVDLLTKTLTIGKDKNGRALRVPFNTEVERVLFDLGTRRTRPSDAREPVFPRRYREPDKFFPRAVQCAQEVLRDAEHHDEAARLDGVSWHPATRHTWASRLSMAGVPPRTLQILGNWGSLKMVERYSHLSPEHLRSAIEKLVKLGSLSAVREGPTVSVPDPVELGFSLDLPATAGRADEVETTVNI